MSDLTLALEKLDASLDELETQISQYERTPKGNSAQNDLFTELSQVKEKNMKIAKGLDSTIEKIEKLLEA